jgi:hypothetical protein
MINLHKIYKREIVFAFMSEEEILDVDLSQIGKPPYDFDQVRVRKNDGRVYEGKLVMDPDSKRPFVRETHERGRFKGDHFILADDLLTTSDSTSPWYEVQAF